MRDYSTLSIWTGGARVKDQTLRLVNVVYLFTAPVVVIRPWQDLLHKPAICRESAVALRILDLLVSIADFSVVGGAWEGRFVGSTAFLRTLVAISKDTICEHLRALADAGFIFYKPVSGRFELTTIRIPVANKITGLPLVAPDDTWRSDFIISVEPMLKLGELSAESFNVPPPVIARIGALSGDLVQRPGLLGRLDLRHGDRRRE